MKKIKLFVLFSIVCLLYSCSKDGASIPNSYVNFSVNVSRYNQLLSPGGYIIAPSEGYGGVILLRTASNNYVAMDLACTNEASKYVKVIPNDSITAAVGTCSVCESKFELLYGTGQPVSGAAKQALRHYNVSQSENYIYVTN